MMPRRIYGFDNLVQRNKHVEAALQDAISLCERIEMVAECQDDVVAMSIRIVTS